jgi:hypothetical protein
MSDWISVKDRLPDGDADYLIFWDSGDGEPFMDTEWYSKSSPFTSCVTHWQPLPPPPADDAG